MKSEEHMNNVIAREERPKQSQSDADCFVPRNDARPNPLFLLPFILLSIFSGCESDTKTADDKETGTTEVRPAGPQFKKEGELYLLKVNGDTIRKIDIEIADTESERTIGMMHRRSAPDSQGMLFIFEEEEPRSFWMHNTLVGLDILYIKQDGTIESIAKYCVPKSDKSIPSRGPATYVLELIEGFCDIHGVEVGDRIDYKRTDGK